MMPRLGFGLLALAMVVAALFVVRSRNLVRAVLWLALVLLLTAALYAILGAPFLAGVQVLTYVGGVVTLMIFGVMVTGRHEGAVAEVDSADRIRGLLLALAFFALVGGAILRTEFPPTLPPPPPPTTAELARSLLTEYLLAFEVASLLLLAAVVGAVVMARRRDPGPTPEGSRQ